MRRAALIILDGLGIGPTHDTAQYGDVGSDTLGNVARAAGGLRLPNLARLGLGHCRPLLGLSSQESPLAAYGIAHPVGAGKDSTTGHWELCGVILEEPLPTYPQGFPADLLKEFTRRTGRGVLANRPASGTAIISEFDGEHRRSGSWIVYTSADSVFQIAAHEDEVPIEELYQGCRIARELLVGPHGVSRVIARPYAGVPGALVRTRRRRDFSLAPPGVTLLDRATAGGVPTVGVGKVDDLFAGRGIQSRHPGDNAEAYAMIGEALGTMERGLLFANVIEFDQSWGHRNDVPGFLAGLAQLDAALPALLGSAQAEDLIIFTADHGNDPTTPSTDHSREAVPILVYGPGVKSVPLGERPTFADIGQTVAEFLELEALPAGTSFLSEVWSV